MILHVTFSDGSNPWVFYGDRHQVAKKWRRMVKRHPDTALPVAYTTYTGKEYAETFPSIGGYLVAIYPFHNGMLCGAKIYKKYKHLGHALAALERLGGETK